ncbi:MAG: CopD family protein [Chloroflexia bacterium]|nr:CopD family protein [Chloroflexia bacterium]
MTFARAQGTASSWASRLLIAALAMIVATVMWPSSASAHAALESSDPANGDVLASAPSEITVLYTERLEQSYSRMELHDSQGEPIEGTSLTFPSGDEYTMVLALPANLPNGTWSVLWRTLSNDDGHTARNYFAFTVGSNADIVPIVIPGSGTGTGDAPQWAGTASRWAALLGVAPLIAAWPVWSTVIRPSLGPVRTEAVPIVRGMRRFVIGAAILAIAGSVFALAVQAWTLPDGTYFDKIVNTLGQTRYGHLWLLRIGLIVVLGLVLAACGWWFMKRRQVEGGIAWIVAAAVALPFSLIAHASAQTSGRFFAIAADAAHLVAASIWAGGIALLVAVLLPGLRRLDPERRRLVLRRLLPRFSTLALICMAVIGVTGFYAGWLHVGNWTALTTTPYGRALMVKLGLLLVILILAGINLLVITRKLVAQEREGAEGSVWTSRLGWTVTGELIAIVVLLAAVGQMTSLQPARDVVAEESRQIAIDFGRVSPSSTLLLAPGVAGPNHFRLEVDGPNLPVDAEALLRLTIPDRDDLGTNEVQLSRVGGNAFEHHGSDLSIAADWQVTAIIREPAAAPISAETTVSIGTTAPDVIVPGDPWRFETLGGVTGLTLMLVGFAGLIVGFRSHSGTSRKESAGLGAAALLLGVILLVQARIDPILASAGGDAIDAAFCTVAPTTLDELATLAGTGEPSATPDPAVADDAQVDEETAAAILATTREMLACTNAMDTMRRMSVFTDDYLSEVFSAGISDEFALEAGQTPVPRAAAELITLVEIREVERLADGRVTATVVTLDPMEQDHLHSTSMSMTEAMTTTMTQLVFAEGEGRWLVDEIIVP